MTVTCASCSAALPPDARFCPACAEPVATEPADEERKHVTVVFADLASSTELADRLDAERLSAILGRFFSEMSEILERWGGHVEKYIGDAVMAVFGLPSVHEDDAERAVRSALEMLDRLQTINEQLERQHGVRLAIRIGINGGEVVVRSAAGPMVAGDAVNISARLEQAAAPGEILVGEDTASAAGGSISFDSPRAVHAKGKAGLLKAWPVLGLLPARGRPATVGAQFVGRGDELRILRDALHRTLADAKPRLVVIEGEAGVGKSRLVRELEVVFAQDDPRIRILRGRCLAAGQRVTFGALAEIINVAAGIGEADGPAMAAKRLRAMVATLVDRDEVDGLVDPLAISADITVPNSRLAAAEPREVARELERAWPRLLTGLAARHRPVVVLEDLHWASSELLGLLPRLLEADGPVLMVGTARPAGDGWAQAVAGLPAVSRLRLEPLGAADSEALLSELVGERGIPPELRAAALERADGNPFFLEEIVRHVVEGGVSAAAELPHSVHALLASRIDLLPPLEKRALREAAVLGRFFHADALANAMATGVAEMLDALHGHGLVLPDPRPGTGQPGEHRFRHALIREVAYGGMSKRRRALAHAEFAAWLAAASSSSDERTELIAEHFQAALSGEGARLAWLDDPEAGNAVRRRAYRAQLVAGNQLRGRSAIARALELHEAGLRLASSEEERAEALEAIGDDHDAAYHGDEAWQALGEALKVRRKLSDREPVARLASKLAAMAAARWGTFRHRPDPGAIEDVVDEGIAAAGAKTHLASLLSYKAATGLRWLAEGQSDPIGARARIAAAENALEIATRMELVNVASNACMTLAQLHSLVGDFRAALAVAERALPLDERLVAGRAASTGFEAANVIAEVGGRFGDALAPARRSLERGRQMSAHHLMHGSYTTMNVLFNLGRWEEIPPLIDEHLDALASERGRGCPYVRGGPVLGALVLAHRGETARAVALLDDHDRNSPAELIGTPDAIAARARVALGSLAVGRSMAERVVESSRHITTEENAYEYLAWLEALGALEDLEGLAAAMPRVRRMASALAVLPPALDRAEALIDVAAGGRRMGRARDRLRSALAAYDAMGVVFEAARTRELLAATVEPAEADELRAHASEAYRQLGARPHLERLASAGPHLVKRSPGKP